jgi:hypothetical protein
MLSNEKKKFWMEHHPKPKYGFESLFLNVSIADTLKEIFGGLLSILLMILNFVSFGLMKFLILFIDWKKRYKEWETKEESN